jgi:hypothetical protein
MDWGKCWQPSGYGGYTRYNPAVTRLRPVCSTTYGNDNSATNHPSGPSSDLSPEARRLRPTRRDKQSPHAKLDSPPLAPVSKSCVFSCSRTSIGCLGLWVREAQ